MKIFLFIHLLLYLFMIDGMSQTVDLSKYQWKHRIVLISAADEHAPLVQEQQDALQPEDDAFLERKLIIIHDVQPQASFSVRLIGLDGGIKHTQQRILTREKLFALIDAMPMRRAEQRKQNE